VKPTLKATFLACRSALAWSRLWLWAAELTLPRVLSTSQCRYERCCVCARVRIGCDCTRRALRASVGLVPVQVVLVCSSH
jgi:hypothetical protein